MNINKITRRQIETKLQGKTVALNEGMLRKVQNVPTVQ